MQANEKPLGINRYAVRLKRKTATRQLWNCAKCGAQIHSGNEIYCGICGEPTLTRGRPSEMTYKKIRLNESGKAVICPHCDNEESTPGDYCMICGSEIVNRCADMKTGDVTSKGCRAVLPGNARFCYKCGNESTFYQRGWLKDWRSENTRKAIENINVAVDFNEIKRTLG